MTKKQKPQTTILIDEEVELFLKEVGQIPSNIRPVIAMLVKRVITLESELVKLKTTNND